LITTKRRWKDDNTDLLRITETGLEKQVIVGKLKTNKWYILIRK